MKSNFAKLGLAGLFCAGVTGAAPAADLIPTPAPEPVYAAPVSWNGFYVGGHVGGGWEEHEGTARSTTALLPNGTSSTADVDGFLGGIHGGYNFQHGPWVTGIEGEVSWTDADGSTTVPSPLIPGGTGSTAVEVDYHATLTGRVGHAWGSWLAYLEAGAAWEEVEYTSTGFIPGVGTLSGSVDDTRTGYVVGGGLEVALAQDWSARAEYNYMDFGSETYIITVGGVGSPVELDTDVHTVKFGLSYHLN